MNTSVKTWLDQLFAALDGVRTRGELSRFNDEQLRDIGVEREFAGMHSSVPWQVAEQGGTGAKVHLHFRAAA